MIPLLFAFAVLIAAVITAAVASAILAVVVLVLGGLGMCALWALSEPGPT